MQTKQRVHTPVGFCGRKHYGWECEQSLAFAVRSLSMSWVSAAVMVNTRVAEWKAHCVRKKKKNQGCDL